MPRIVITTLLSITGNIIIGIALLSDSINNFYATVFAATLHGAACGLGDVVFLGYLKGFPILLLAGWSAGVGFSGIFGTGLILSLKSFGLEEHQIFLLAVPFNLLYLGLAWYLHVKKQEFPLFHDDSTTEQAGASGVIDTEQREVDVETDANLVSDHLNK